MARQKFITPSIPDNGDLTDLPFHYWTVVAFDVEGSVKYRRWICRCKCGVLRSVMAYNLIHSISKSCGCYRAEAVGQRSRVHDGYGTPEYNAHRELKQRCQYPSHRQYNDYGGRGITVCERWQSFENFLADMGKRPSPELSIERKDNNGGYWCGHCPECRERKRPANCKWATRIEQSNNQRSNHLIAINGRTLTLAQWVPSSPVSRHTIEDRIKRGWDPAAAVTTPGPVPRHWKP